MNRRTAGTLEPDSIQHRNFLCVRSSVGDFYTPIIGILHRSSLFLIVSSLLFLGGLDSFIGHWGLFPSL